MHPKSILDKYDIKAKKSLGQNFLFDDQILARISDAAELSKNDIVLEIGAGSGYNAALMSHLCKKVYAVETVPELVKFAQSNLKKAKIKNVEVIKGDGSLGYKKAAPYNKIIRTAACPKIPQPWIDQVEENGIIVAPVGDRFSQEMVKAIKKEGELSYQKLGPFVFVPLRGKHRFE